MKRIIISILALMLTFTLFGCGASSNSSANYVRFEMENGDVFIVELYPAVAPETVANFKNLVASDFYDGLTFHRVETDILIQGGDPKGNGTGRSDKAIKGEFASNGFENNLSHTRGVVSMARLGNDPNSASSQFFIVHKDSTYLDGEYAAFGCVVYGMDIVDEIASVRTNSSDRPVSKVTMTSIRFAKPAN